MKNGPTIFVNQIINTWTLFGDLFHYINVAFFSCYVKSRTIFFIQQVSDYYSKSAIWLAYNQSF